MNRINWKIRFTKNNLTFVIRFIGALFVPIFIYMGLEVEDLTSWPVLGAVFTRAISNPYIMALTVINAINLLPDPTTEGFGDSQRALHYTKIREEEVV